MHPLISLALGSVRMVPVSPEHASAIVGWRSDIVIRTRFLSGHAFSLASQLAWTQRQQEDPTDYTYVALIGQEPAGMVAVYGIDPQQRHGEYGRIVVDPQRQRQGLGLAMSQWIVALGFDDLELQHIYANCLADNAPIHALLARLGFRPVSRWRHAVSGVDVLRLEASRATWEDATSKSCNSRLPRKKT